MTDRLFLTGKQQRFIDEYFACGLNAAEAARKAGYSRRTANRMASENLSKPVIAAEIERRRTAISEKLRCTADDIAREMHKLGFSNMGDYMRSTDAGDPYLDFSGLTEDQTAALSEVTVEDFVDGRGPNARDVKRVKFKLFDKRASLVDLAKLLGVMPGKHEHSGPGGQPIPVITEIRRVIVYPEGKEP